MQSDANPDPYANYDTEFVHIKEEEQKPVQTISMQTDIKKKTSILKIILYSIFVIVLLAVGIVSYVYYAFNVPSESSTVPIVIDIPKGSSLQSVTKKLGNAGVIHSSFLFRSSMILGGLESSIKTGEYTFSKPLVMAEVIERLVKGKYEYVPVRLIIREGEDARDIEEAIHTQFPKLDTTALRAELQKREGRLFPETYMFAPFATIDEIIGAIDAQYQKRIARYLPDIASSTNSFAKSETEILTIASILEKEVPVKDDMHIVAGIIYNRLAQGMPLQMDSTVGYVTGKASLELTLDDLKFVSPYNTYMFKGLPPGPIGNPGDASIDAALHPASHGYIFFLSDASGVNHYAKTYTEHLANRKKYLGK